MGQQPGAGVTLTGVKFLLGLVVAAAFGPYLFGGVRTDQAVVYGLAAVLLVPLAPRIRLRPAGWVVVTAWLTLLLVAAVQWRGVEPNTSPWVRGSALASFDNLALPIVTFLLVAGLNQHRAIELVTKVVTIGASVNALVAIGDYLSPAAFAPLLARFWGGGDTGDRALTLGRYTGLIGQPSVAGALYCLAVVCAVYSLRNRPGWRGLVLTLLILGGILTISKGFLLIGLPVAAWQLWKGAGKAGHRVVGLLVVAALYFGGATLGLFSKWSGFQRVLDLLPGNGATFNTYTGNRYGATSSTQPITHAVLVDHPWFGYGLPGLAKATDTAWLQGLVLAGLFGAACVAVVLVAVLVGWRGWQGPERLLFGGVAVVVAATALGTPVLTANRVSVLVWALLALMLSQPYARTTDGSGGSRAEIVDVAVP